MAGNARYTALLDACVLFPVAVCDALMSVAATGVYAPKWSQRIDQEWMRRLEEEKGTPHGTYATRCDRSRLCLVTFNLRDFPVEVLGPLGIEVLHPDSFLAAQLDLDTLRVLPAFKKMRARLRNPAFTPAAFADAMERNGLPQTASLLRDAAELI
jgi:hypothetical protein